MRLIHAGEKYGYSMVAILEFRYAWQGGFRL